MHAVLTISTEGIFLSSLRYIDKRLEPFKKSGNVTTKIAAIGTRNQLVITFSGFKGGMLQRDGARDAETTRRISLALIDAIADVVITDCKYHYIETNLKLPIEDEISHHAFIRALANFDHNTDRSLAKSLLKNFIQEIFAAPSGAFDLTPNFLLDSFYLFCLDPLKMRWQEVCSLANDNACFLVCDGTFRELLRFLISNLETREPEVHIFWREDKIELLTTNLKPINIYVNDELSQDIQVVSKLVSIAPKRIVLHKDSLPRSHKDSHSKGHNESPPNGPTDSPSRGEGVALLGSDGVVDFIQNLFGSCVQVVQN